MDGRRHGDQPVRLNASTLNTFYYEPTHLARQLTTLDVLSDSRLDVDRGSVELRGEIDQARTELNAVSK